jgi:hypothetical protein
LSLKQPVLVGYPDLALKPLLLRYSIARSDSSHQLRSNDPVLFGFYDEPDSSAVAVYFTAGGDRRHPRGPRDSTQCVSSGVGMAKRRTG